MAKGQGKYGMRYSTICYLQRTAGMLARYNGRDYALRAYAQSFQFALRQGYAQQIARLAIELAEIGGPEAVRFCIAHAWYPMPKGKR